MSNITHIQYPVGQGGLHLGIIGDVAYIYDCGCFSGSKANFTKIFNDIKSRLDNCNKLFIYISHLHTDHYNKLNDLLSLTQTKKIRNKKIFLPASSNIEKIMLLAEFEDVSHDYADYYNFIVDPHFDNADDINITEVIKGQEKENSLSNGYVLYPYITNIDMNDIEMFRQVLKNNKFNPDNLLKSMKNSGTWSKIRELFVKTFRQRRVTNGIMLCLYCGAISGEKYWCPCVDSVGVKPMQFNPYGAWLHTGDAELTLNTNLPDFYNHYKNVLCNVSFMQIPHHGSKNNHDMWLNKIFNFMGLTTVFYFTTQTNCNAKENISDLNIFKHQLHRITDINSTKIQIEKRDV